MDGTTLVIAIFCLRLLNNAMGTVRVIFLTYGRRLPAFVLAFIESLIFAYTASKVLTDLENIPNLLAYAGGFAVGGYVGMYIEEKFVTGYVTVNIIAKQGGHEIAMALRENSFGVTEMIGEGGNGKVIMLRAVLLRQHIGDVMDIAHGINPEAFVTIEEARAVHRGWMRERKMHWH